MYNDSYYSRRGRTIERKKVDSGQVINPRLIPIYYNYLKDNGLFPSAPLPPVHVDDGTCIAVDYSPAQSYSFPEVNTSLTDALGTLLFNLGIDVDITKVDHIVLDCTFKGLVDNTKYLFFPYSVSSSVSNSTLAFGTMSGSSGRRYVATFVRDYSQSGTDFYLAATTGSTSNPLSSTFPHAVQQASDSNFYINRIVVATLTE